MTNEDGPLEKVGEKLEDVKEKAADLGDEVEQDVLQSEDDESTMGSPHAADDEDRAA